MLNFVFKGITGLIITKPVDTNIIWKNYEHVWRWMHHIIWHAWKIQLQWTKCDDYNLNNDCATWFCSIKICARFHTPSRDVNYVAFLKNKKKSWFWKKYFMIMKFATCLAMNASHIVTNDRIFSFNELDVMISITTMIIQHSFAY